MPPERGGHPHRGSARLLLLLALVGFLAGAAQGQALLLLAGLLLAAFAFGLLDPLDPRR